jgi:hypothetical protein
MRPELAALAAQQGGLVTRRQAIDAGYRERELRTLTATHGAWVTVRRGVYVERALWEGVDDSGQWTLRDRAAHLAMTKSHAMSHDSAARLLGLETLTAKRPLSHILRPGVGGSRTEHGVKHHLSRVSPREVEMVDGIQVTGLARTALDIGREHGFEAGAVAVDGAMRRGVTRRQLQDELELMENWPHITSSRAAVDVGDAGAETVGETMARLLVLELGIGRPSTQFAVRIPSGVAWCDLRVGCHVFEFDGRIKYQRVENGGVADRPVEDVLWDERKRQQEICALGLGVSRIIWSDFYGPARGKAKQRLLDEYAVTARRFGQDLPEALATFAAAMQGKRQAG